MTAEEFLKNAAKDIQGYVSCSITGTGNPVSFQRMTIKMVDLSDALIAVSLAREENAK